MIHKYKLNNYNIVIDTYSSAIHVLDDIAFDILSYIEDYFPDVPSRKLVSNLLKKYSKKDIFETYDELYKVFLDGKLFSSNQYQSLSNIKSSESNIKSMCLNIAHDCNLRCDYCFASKGNFGGDRCLMSLDTAKKAIDFLILNSGKRYNLDVEFFGGEPLMGFETVKQTVDYARRLESKYNKQFRFTITTNGILLNDENIDFINREMSNVVLSLDGRKEINDRLRTTVGGHGSYDSIIPKYQKLIKNRGDKEYYIRGTFTKYNLDFTKDVLHIYNLGFNKISVEPVMLDPNISYSINENELDAVFKEYENLAMKIIELKKQGSEIDFFRFSFDPNNTPCISKLIRGCGCGSEYIAVTPNGDLFPCHQFVGENSWIIGNLHSGTFNQDIRNKFLKSNIFYNDGCDDCWAKLLCGGGCNANNWNYTGNTLKSHKLSCDLEKKRIECAIMISIACADK